MSAKPGEDHIPPAGDTVPPTISGENISPSALVPERGSGPSATAGRKRGARVTFKLSKAAKRHIHD